MLVGWLGGRVGGWVVVGTWIMAGVVGRPVGWRMQVRAWLPGLARRWRSASAPWLLELEAADAGGEEEEVGRVGEGRGAPEAEVGAVSGGVETLVRECQKLEAELGVPMPQVGQVHESKMFYELSRYAKGMKKVEKALKGMGGVWREGAGAAMVSETEMALADGVAQASPAVTGNGVVPAYLRMHRPALTSWIKKMGFKVTQRNGSLASVQESAWSPDQPTPSATSSRAVSSAWATSSSGLGHAGMRESSGGWSSRTFQSPGMGSSIAYQNYGGGGSPSSKQLAFAQSVIDGLSLVPPDGWERDSRICSEFLDEHVHLLDSRPSSSQLGAVRAIMQQGIATPPEGWESNRRMCSDFLDQHFHRLPGRGGDVSSPVGSSTRTGPSLKQIAFAEKIIASRGISSPPQGWNTDLNVCKQFLDEHAPLMDQSPPSPSQLGAVRAVMQQGIATPPEGWESNRRMCSDFLDQHFHRLPGRGGEGSGPSEKQLAFAASIITTLRISSPPEGWDTDRTVCKKFLDDHVDEMPPTPKQIQLAEAIADNRDLRLPPEIRLSAKAVSAFIDQHRDNQPSDHPSSGMSQNFRPTQDPRPRQDGHSPAYNLYGRSDKVRLPDE